MTTCPQHKDSRKCEASARALLRSLDERAAATEALESVIWEAVSRRLGNDWAADFLEANDPCDCWKHGVLPLPSLARSALLFHWQLPGGKTPAEFVSGADLRGCPVLFDFLAAQKGARLSFFRIGRESKKLLELVDAANEETTVVQTPFSKGWMKTGYLLFGRVLTFRGRQFLAESEGMPLANRPANDAVRKLRTLAAQDRLRTGRLFEIFFEDELTGLETEGADPAVADGEEEEPFLLRRGGNMPN